MNTENNLVLLGSCFSLQPIAKCTHHAINNSNFQSSESWSEPHLPADSTREILHDELVIGPGGRPVLVQPDWPPAAVAAARRAIATRGAVAATAAASSGAPAISVAPVRCPSGNLYSDPKSDVAKEKEIEHLLE